MICSNDLTVVAMVSYVRLARLSPPQAVASCRRDFPRKPLPAIAENGNGNASLLGDVSEAARR